MSIETSREGLIRLRGNSPLFSRASVTRDRTTYVPMEVMTRQATYFVSEECKQIHKDAASAPYCTTQGTKLPLRIESE
jgi:hypothetical protein